MWSTKTPFASIAAKCFRALSGLFSPNLIDQSSCRILTTHAKTRSFCMMIGQLYWEKIDLIKVLKELSAMLRTVYGKGLSQHSVILEFSC